MLCHKCAEKAAIELQHGALCKSHFLSYYEDKVFKAIKKYQLITAGDSICVAASGGKDSQAALYLTQKFIREHNIQPKDFFALAIDEGIAGYREHTLADLQQFCAQYNIPLHTIKAQEEFKFTLDEAYPKINLKTKKKPCTLCGVWRRYLINKYARKLGATKLITGHNLDDEAQAIIMNIFKANTDLAAHLGPRSGVQDHQDFVSRCKPLYFCTEKETRLYALLRNFPITFHECPYAQQGYRSKIQDMLNEFENKYPGTKQGVIQSFLALLPILKEKALQEHRSAIKSCIRCQEPANQEVCNACMLLEQLS